MRKGFVHINSFPMTNSGQQAAVAYYRSLEKKGYDTYIDHKASNINVYKSINKVLKIAKRTGAIYKSKITKYTNCDLCDSKAYSDEHGRDMCTVYDGCADADKTARRVIRPRKNKRRGKWK